MKPSTWVLALAPSVSVAVAFLLVWQRMPRAEADVGGDAGFWDQSVVDFVRDRVAGGYVDPLPREKTTQMFYAALDAYVGALDPYSDFLSPDDYRTWVEHHAGHYAGIGIRVDGEADGLHVVGVLPGGPADRAGLRIGDVVTAVDGRSLATAELTQEETVRALKGARGSKVVVTVRSKADPETGASPSRQLTVVRDDIQQPTVHARRVGPDDRYVHLRVGEFVDTTDDEFDRALDRALEAGAQGVVLDLRGNGGGVLDATVRIADRFLRSGDIVRTVGRTADGGQTHVAKDAGTIPESVALVVLVDRFSASASELLAGALQDHRRGLLVGQRTHGKFLVQSILPIPGKEAAVKLTTARYTTPLGRWFRRTTRQADVAEGLLPDVPVELSPEERVRFAKSIKNVDAAAWGSPPAYPEVSADWIDPVLERAVGILEGAVAVGDVAPAPAAPSKG